MRVYPTPGLIVRDPVLRDALPAEGRDVDDGDLYWIRRLNDGDATLTPPNTGGRQVVTATATQPAQAPADKGSSNP